MLRNLLTVYSVIILCAAVAAAPPLALSQEPSTPGESLDSPGNSGSAPGKNKDKDKDKDPDHDQVADQDQDLDQDQEGLGGTASSKEKITWELSKSEVADALLMNPSVVVRFQTSAPLENVGFWLTPSLDPYLEVTPLSFESLDSETWYEVEIALVGEPPTKTIGGTLHLVPTGESEDGLRRTYPQPLPINIKFRDGGDESDGGDPVEEQTLAVVNSASYGGAGIAPLQIVSIFGTDFGLDGFQSAVVIDGQITDYLADVQVFFDGTASPILFASATQLNVIVPSDVDGKSEVTLTVTYQGDIWEVAGIPIVAAAPEIFSMTGLGHGLAAAIDWNGELVSIENPVAPGEWITFFGTGVGLWKDGFIDGTVVDPQNLPEPEKPVVVKIGGAVLSEEYVLYIGGAPGMANGVVQFNVVVPPLSEMELSTDTEPPNARIELTSGGEPSKADIFVYIEEASTQP